MKRVEKGCSDEAKKIAWKSHREKLLNTELAWDRNSLS